MFCRHERTKALDVEKNGDGPDRVLAWGCTMPFRRHRQRERGNKGRFLVRMIGDGMGLSFVLAARVQASGWPPLSFQTARRKGIFKHQNRQASCSFSLHASNLPYNQHHSYFRACSSSSPNQCSGWSTSVVFPNLTSDIVPLDQVPRHSSGIEVRSLSLSISAFIVSQAETHRGIERCTLVLRRIFKIGKTLGKAGRRNRPS